MSMSVLKAMEALFWKLNFIDVMCLSRVIYFGAEWWKGSSWVAFSPIPITDRRKQVGVAVFGTKIYVFMIWVLL